MSRFGHWLFETSYATPLRDNSCISHSTIVVSRSSDGQPCTQAGVVVKLAKSFRAHAKLTTTTASVYGGARSAPPYTQAVLVVNFAWAR